jgi:VanZ family protein
MTIGSLIGTVPWFLPGMGLTIALSALLCTAIGRWIGAGAVRTWLLLLGLGLVVVTTLTPQRDALERGAIGSGTCDFSRIWFAPLDFYQGANDSAENILLFVPLGIAIALLPARLRRIAIPAGLLLPVAVELLQRQVTVLNRSCQSADVVDNVAGLLIGMAIGMVTTLALRLVPAARRWRTASVRAGRRAHRP